MDKVRIFFEDLTYHSNYEFLEFGKDDDELKAIASKRGIELPSKDLAVFKGRYALVDQRNKNGCTLPKKEVRKALKTLVGKAVDKDHLRKATIGYWLDASLEDDEIISYGAFWKGNFPEDFEDIQNRMKEGKVKISFEAWGDRQMTDEKAYNLTNIEFAGGALLFDTTPACDEAEVLEFAKVVDPITEIILDTDNKIEEARLDFNYDNETIARIMYEAICPTCEMKGWHDIMSIDYENNKISSKCPGCGGKNEYELTPKSTIIKKGKKLQPVEESKIVKKEKEISTAVLEDGREKGGTGMEELLKKYNKASIEEVVASLESTIESANASIASKDTELTTLKTDKDGLVASLEEAKKAVEMAKLEVVTIKDLLDKKLSEEKAMLIKARREELGEEFAKDLSDEDILDATKFELAKTKKELAVVKASKGKEQGGLEAGSKKPEGKDPLYTKQDRIQKNAWEE